jgi:hypothetical protein
MGIDCSSTLGYGFKVVGAKLLEGLLEDDMDPGKGFELAFHGGFEESETFLLIKKSAISKDCYDDCKRLNAAHFNVLPEWDQMLLDWAKKHNVKNPKIGWFLLASMS